MDPRAALRTWLRHAAAAYGDDLPVAAAGAIRGLAPRASTGPNAAAAASPQAARPGPTAPRELAGGAPRRPAARHARRPDAEPARDTAVQPAPDIELPVDLDEQRRVVTTCRRCKLCAHRTQTVFGEGAADARVMFVGEAPGAREDEQGRPFVGPAGRLLTRIIENAMGIGRADVYIANVNKCRPPGNRNPEPDEIASCLPFLRAQIRSIQPEVIVALGRVAAQNLLGTQLPMSRLRGQELAYEGVPVIATWHPAYLLRQPDAKRDTWEDIKRANRLLGLPEVPKPRGGGAA